MSSRVWEVSPQREQLHLYRLETKTVTPNNDSDPDGEKIRPKHTQIPVIIKIDHEKITQKSFYMISTSL